MGQEEKITLIERDDLGPVLARADHVGNVIEVNKKAFYGLPPMVQEFVLCHEVCHLRQKEWDEARTNELAASLFLDRARNREDREARLEFLSYLDGTDSSYSNWWQAVLALLPSAWNLGKKIYGAIENYNSGWYSWDSVTKKSNLDIMLHQAFEESRRSGSKSAADFFWAQMRNYDNKDSSLDGFLNRSENAWVQNAVAKYEKQYGFGFKEVTPIDITAFPLVMVAIGAVIGLLVYKIVKKTRK